MRPLNREHPNLPDHRRRPIGAWLVFILITLSFAVVPSATVAQQTDEDLVSLDFADVELPKVIDTISRMTGKNFIYDDRVRGRVTIVSPTEVTVDQAFAVFESVLKVKGFSLLMGPGETHKILRSGTSRIGFDTVRGESSAQL